VVAYSLVDKTGPDLTWRR